MMIAFRLMLFLLVGVICYCKTLERFYNELSTLLFIVLIQDVAMASLFRGILNGYALICTYIPIVLLVYSHHRLVIQEKIHLMKHYMEEAFDRSLVDWLPVWATAVDTPLSIV